MRSGKLTLLLVLVAFGSCRPDTVELAYAFEEGQTFNYEMKAQATASWSIGGRGSGSYKIAYAVEEKVVSLDDEGATVAVTMTPSDIVEEGLPSPGPTERTFTLQVGNEGELLGVLEIDGVPAEALDPDALAFIGTYRPPLPADPVRLRDTWKAQQELALGSVFQQVTTIGRLLTLDLDEDGEVADVSYRGEGPLVWTTTLPQGAAELSGAATSSGVATVNIEHGYLQSSRSTTSGRFEVRIVPGAGQATLSGQLSLELEMSLERL